jgi:signal transduction histidine kinase
LVEVQLRQESQTALMTVSDEGCGLAPEELPRVFEPFYQSPQKRARGEPGVGLGLAVASRIATRFNGTIRVRSELGRGSQFEVVLPAADVASDSADDDRAARTPIGAADHGEAVAALPTQA